MAHQLLHEEFFTNYHEEAAQILETFQIPDILRLMQTHHGQKISRTCWPCMSPVVAAEVITAMSTDLSGSDLAGNVPGDCGLAAATAGRTSVERDTDPHSLTSCQ